MVNEAYSHPLVCGLGGACGPATYPPDNEILLVLSHYQILIFAILITGATTFGVFVIWKNRPRKVVC